MYSIYLKFMPVFGKSGNSRTDWAILAILSSLVNPDIVQLKIGQSCVTLPKNQKAVS